MSDTSVIMDVRVVLKHIDIKLKQLDATEERVIESFIKAKMKQGKRKLFFFKVEITKEMAEKMLDEPGSLFRTYRQYYTNWIVHERNDLNEIKKMCYDACDGKITLSKVDYRTVMGE